MTYNKTSGRVPDVQDVSYVIRNMSVQRKVVSPVALFKKIDSDFMTNNSGTKKNGADIDPFRESMGRIVLFAELFGAMPVIGIRDADAERVHFTWKSVKTVYCCVITAGNVALGVFAIIHMLHDEITFQRTAGPIFCAASTTGIILFFGVAKKWGDLMVEWQKNDHIMTKYESTINLSRRLNGVFLALIISATVEHGMALYADASSVQISSCTPVTLVELNKRRFLNVFSYIPYNLLVGIIFQIINSCGTFVWNFVDIFIILISIALKERFSRINYKLRLVEHMLMPQDFWQEIREHYNSLSLMTRKFNDALSSLIFLSFSANLYFICLQLFLSMTVPPQRLVRAIYFYFSFLFLLSRTLLLMLITSSVNEESQLPLVYIHSVPTRCYCTELERLVSQLRCDLVVLTGLDFFEVRRGIILTVVGTIITYELVLIQLDTADGDIKLVQPNCFANNTVSV